MSLVVLLLVSACASSSPPAERSLAEQLAGENRTVTEEARGLIVSLPGILFDFDKAELRPEVEETLRQIAEVLKKYPDIDVMVEGHTDDVGDEQYNQSLSDRRALAVHTYLISQGIDPGHMTHSGFGETRPVAGNDAPEGRQRNRRVDLVIPDPPQ
jgi:outer membrane protein OmpA-like peptidoglycan-associated protein